MTCPSRVCSDPHGGAFEFDGRSVYRWIASSHVRTLQAGRVPSRPSDNRHQEGAGRVRIFCCTVPFSEAALQYHVLPFRNSSFAPRELPPYVGENNVLFQRTWADCFAGAAAARMAYANAVGLALLPLRDSPR